MHSEKSTGIIIIYRQFEDVHFEHLGTLERHCVMRGGQLTFITLPVGARIIDRV